MLPSLLTEHVLSLLCKHLMLLYGLKEQTLARGVTALGSGIFSRVKDSSGLGMILWPCCVPMCQNWLGFYARFHFEGTGQIYLHFDH